MSAFEHVAGLVVLDHNPGVACGSTGNGNDSVRVRIGEERGDEDEDERVYASRALLPVEPRVAQSSNARNRVGRGLLRTHRHRLPGPRALRLCVAGTSTGTLKRPRSVPARIAGRCKSVVEHSDCVLEEKLASDGGDSNPTRWKEEEERRIRFDFDARLGFRSQLVLQIYSNYDWK